MRGPGDVVVDGQPGAERVAVHDRARVLLVEPVRKVRVEGRLVRGAADGVAIHHFRPIAGCDLALRDDGIDAARASRGGPLGHDDVGHEEGEECGECGARVAAGRPARDAGEVGRH